MRAISVVPNIMPKAPAPPQDLQQPAAPVARVAVEADVSRCRDCGKILTADEAYWYLYRCDVCEGDWAERMENYRNGADDQMLDLLFSVGSSFFRLTKRLNIMSNWIKVSDQMPMPGVTVLAYYANSHNMHRIIRACWIKQYTEEEDCFANYEITEYCEEQDTFYIPEGWWEQIDNWDDCSQVTVHEGEITHWMPLPTPPVDLDNNSHS